MIWARSTCAKNAQVAGDISVVAENATTEESSAVHNGGNRKVMSQRVKRRQLLHKMQQLGRNRDLRFIECKGLLLEN